MFCYGTGQKLSSKTYIVRSRNLAIDLYKGHWYCNLDFYPFKIQGRCRSIKINGKDCVHLNDLTKYMFI